MQPLAQLLLPVLRPRPSGSSGAGKALAGYPGGYLCLNPTAAGSANYFVLPDPATCPGRVYYLRNTSGSFSAYVGTAAGSRYGASADAPLAGSYEMKANAVSKTVVTLSAGTSWTIGFLN